MKIISAEDIRKASYVFIIIGKVNTLKINKNLNKNKNIIILLVENCELKNINELSKNYSNLIVRKFSWNIFHQKHYYRYIPNINSEQLLKEKFYEIINDNKKITDFIKNPYNNDNIIYSFKKQLLLEFKKKIEAKYIYEKIVEINPDIKLLNEENINLLDIKTKKFILLKIKNLLLFLFYPIYSCLFLKLNYIDKKKYSLALRVYDAGLNFDENTYNLDWVVDKESIKKSDVLLVIEDRISKDFLNSIKKKYDYTFSSKRKPLGKLSISLIKNNLKLFIKSLFQLNNFFKTEIFYQKILLNVWTNYFVWNNFICAFKPVSYLSYHDFQHNHISRNILLNKINCISLMYKHTNSETVFDIRERYSNISYAYDFHDIEFHWTKESAKMAELNFSKSKKIVISSPLWSCKEFENENQLAKINSLVPNKSKNIIATFSAAFDTIGAFNNLDSHLSFLNFMKKILISRRDVFIFFKPKYNPNLLKNYPNLYEVYEKLLQNENFKTLNKITSKNLISVSNLTISMPFVSTTIEAISSGKKAFWADINNNFPNSAYMDIDKLVANSNSQALDLVDYWLTINKEKFSYFLNNQIKDRLPLNFNNEATKKIRSTILSNFRN
tara:strand:+ start:21669 stop:23504 length:1836 start_codon:yes stop_codon:yes gene_type:complete